MSATKTIGGDATKLDEASTKWFDTLCTGIKPLVDLSSSAGSGQASAGANSAAAGIKTAATSLTDTVKKLKALPPPTFDGGAEFASKAETALGTLGDALTKAANGDASAASGLNESQLNDLQALQPTAQLQQAVLAIPSCKAAGFGGTS